MPVLELGVLHLLLYLIIITCPPLEPGKAAPGLSSPPSHGLRVLRLSMPAHPELAPTLDNWDPGLLFSYIPEST